MGSPSPWWAISAPWLRPEIVSLLPRYSTPRVSPTPIERAVRHLAQSAGTSAEGRDRQAQIERKRHRKSTALGAVMVERRAWTVIDFAE